MSSVYWFLLFCCSVFLPPLIYYSGLFIPCILGGGHGDPDRECFLSIMWDIKEWKWATREGWEGQEERAKGTLCLHQEAVLSRNGDRLGGGTPAGRLQENENFRETRGKAAHRFTLSSSVCVSPSVYSSITDHFHLFQYVKPCTCNLRTRPGVFQSFFTKLLEFMTTYDNLGEFFFFWPNVHFSETAKE